MEQTDIKQVLRQIATNADLPLSAKDSWHQKMNSKEIADTCDIDKHLHSISQSYYGYIKSWSSHRNSSLKYWEFIEQTQHYAKLTDNKVY
jgi:hypothetical protein